MQPWNDSNFDTCVWIPLRRGDDASYHLAASSPSELDANIDVKYEDE